MLLQAGIECTNCETPLGIPLVDDTVINTPFIGWPGYSNIQTPTPQSHACVACIHLPSTCADHVLPFSTQDRVWTLYTSGGRHWLDQQQAPPFCLSRENKVGAIDPTPGTDEPYSREEVTAALETVTQWQFASTYSHPNDRHDYTIARWWDDSTLYDKIIKSMWNHMEDVWFQLSGNDRPRRYSSFVSNGWRYWSFPPKHEGINRCVHTSQRKTKK